MKKFEILEHISDLKIRVFGKDKKELFENAMIGMFKAARYKEIPNSYAKTKINVSGEDLSLLLVNFLSEVLYFCETKKEIYQKIVFKKFSEKNIEAVLIGKKLKRMGVEIKGVSYHNLKIIKNKNWKAIILFDI